MNNDNAGALVSIIMPVYNSEKFLEQAVSSVLQQDYRNIELFIVDDGSTDKSPQICDEISKKDERVKVIHQKNGGICNARNRAFSKITGKYVTFCDHDDIWLPGFLSENIKIAEETGVDQVRFYNERVYVRNEKVLRKEIVRSKATGEIKKEDVSDIYFDLVKVSEGVWTGIYRSKVIKENGITFFEGLKFGYEDFYFNLQFLQVMNRMYVNPKVFYRWIVRQESSTSRKFSENRIYAITQCMILEETLNEQYRISKMDSDRWAEHLTDKYIMRMLQTLTREECKIKWRKKVDYLRAFRKETSFVKLADEINCAKRVMKKKSKLLFVLFVKNRMNLLLFMYKMNAKICGKV